MAIRPCRHQLNLRKLKDEINGCECHVCESEISEFAYYCGEPVCNFKIHKLCASEEMVHPFHPQHTLTLLTQLPKILPSSLICSVCGTSVLGLSIYQCFDCDFRMDLSCASLMPTKKGNKAQVLSIKPPHPHQLILCDQKKSFNFCCSCCKRLIIEGHLIFVCLQCNVFLDDSCAQLPHKIEHSLHPSHFLTLTITKTLRRKLPVDRKRCYACGEYLLTSFYGCHQCDFKLCLGCESLMPTSTNDKTNQDGHQTDQKQVITHPHPLIQCYRSEYFCYGCFLRLEDGGKNSISIYVCLDCQMLLCKSCVCLPHEVEHPFHPAHPLRLAGHNILQTRSVSEVSYHECAVCFQAIFHNSRGLFYKCQECLFYLHIRCNSLKPIFINSQLHLQHPLAFLDKEVITPCRACELFRNYPMFSCMECRYIFHAHCLPDLPAIVKHKCHLHPLTLTHSPIKDYEDEGDDSEFYCDTCETHRRLNDPTYYCVECHYVAHVHCVISEVLPYLQRESSLGDNLGTIKLDIALDVAEDHAVKNLVNDATAQELEVILETSLLSGKGDHDQATARANDSLEEATEELGSMVADFLLDELDTKIATLHKREDELKAKEKGVTKQLEALTRRLEAANTIRDTNNEVGTRG